jgi:hypothetical protein
VGYGGTGFGDDGAVLRDDGGGGFVWRPECLSFIGGGFEGFSQAKKISAFGAKGNSCAPFLLPRSQKLVPEGLLAQNTRQSPHAV